VKRLQLKLSPSYTDDDLVKHIQKHVNYPKPYYRIISKSLDARNKNNIHFFLNIDVDSKPLIDQNQFVIPKVKKELHVTVVGLGPAGYFAALVLAQAGLKVTVVEKGKPVAERSNDIKLLDENGIFNPRSNYLFGEGGAGTFSDGKLTSRTKAIRTERDYIYRVFIDAGAPEEISYLSKPHVGSDNLRMMMPKLREYLLRNNVSILFDTSFERFEEIPGLNKLIIKTTSGELDSDFLIIASGHSSYETYRSLIKSGVAFIPKPGAIGVRIEHQQRIINEAQWGKEKIDGLKAAEYTLTYNSKTARAYSFCMCPGGMVVPAARTEVHSGVNGASEYSRSGTYANSALIVPFRIEQFLNGDVTALETLEYFEKLQYRLYKSKQSLAMPVSSIRSFIHKKSDSHTVETSYPFETYSSDFSELLDETVFDQLREALGYFSKKIKGFDTGSIIGTELTSSALIQAVREQSGMISKFNTVYVSGEASGYAGGIISSAADGIRAALDIITKVNQS
jgi:uncharacterized FAD-dependent dehydrogenase